LVSTEIISKHVEKVLDSLTGGLGLRSIPEIVICLADIGAVLCFLEDGSLTLRVLCPHIILFQYIQQLTLFNTCFAQSLDPVVNTRFYSGTIRTNPLSKKIFYTCFIITKTHNLF
jgi:hypothetical protein